MKKQSIISVLSKELTYRSQGLINGQYRIKPEISHLAKPTIHNYSKLPLSAQHVVSLSKSIRGKLNVKSGQKGGFIFQMSNGTQQIKLYDPKIYEKNAENTPLRKRARQIMQLSLQAPKEVRNEVLRNLYRTMPYYLHQEQRVNLRLKNFYYSVEPVRGSKLRIYKASDRSRLCPETDELIFEKSYGAKREVPFEYGGDTEEYYYALNVVTGEISNVLHFIWEEDFEPVIDKCANIYLDIARVVGVLGEGAKYYDGQASEGVESIVVKTQRLERCRVRSLRMVKSMS